MATKAKTGKLLELDVNFGNVNIGEETARIGINVGRKAITVTQADKHLCGKRLTGKIISDAGNANGAQPAMFEAGETVEAVFDVKSIGVSTKAISFGLTVMLKSVKIDELAHFAKRAGKLLIDEVGDIPEDEGDEEEEAEEDE